MDAFNFQINKKNGAIGMKKEKGFKALASLALALIFLIVSSLHPQIAPSLSVQVTFLDGSKLDVRDIKFIYAWIYQSDAKYFNPPYHQKGSLDFHYAEVVHNVQIDRVLSYQTIAKIELSWPKPDKADESYFTPDRIIITLKDGKTVVLKDIDATAAFLLDKAVEQVTADTVLRNLEIEGLATGEGQTGKFKGRISSRAGAHLQPNEAIKEIIVIDPKE